MNVSLGTKWERFVEDKVSNGDYQTASEVLRDGLRLLEKQELLKRISVQSLPELEAKLVKAVESIETFSMSPFSGFGGLRQKGGAGSDSR
jgi:antitoxin ParD1/3/4